jgi:hypothetical protein
MIPVASVVTHLCHNIGCHDLLVAMTDRPRSVEKRPAAIWRVTLFAWLPGVIDDPVLFGAWVAIAGLLLFV